MSEATPQTNDGSNQQWWLSEQGKVTGPRSETYIQTAVRTGALPSQTYACPVGGQEWKRLLEWPMFATTCTKAAMLVAESHPTAPPPPPQPVAAKAVRAPWNPRTIAWLGLILSPIWAGIMAALNTRRLGLELPIWRPIAIGVGATVFDSLPLVDSWLFRLLLYCGTLWVTWYVDLRLQEEPYQRHHHETGSQAAWLVPALARRHCLSS